MCGHIEKSLLVTLKHSFTLRSKVNLLRLLQLADLTEIEFTRHPKSRYHNKAMVKK